MDAYRTEKEEWAEPLPEKCPPEKASQPKRDEYYRLVDKIPPQEDDFRSLRMMFPKKKFHVGECFARACSLFSSAQPCVALLKLQRHKNKKIIRIVLPPESGLIQKTMKDPCHYSWWRRKDFNPTIICEEVSTTTIP